MALLGLGKNYRSFWSARLLSSLGTGMSTSAMPLLAASVTSSPRLISGIAIAGELPWFVLGLVAGAVVDRFDRRRIIIGAQMIRACIAVLLILAVLSDRVTMPLIYAIVVAGALAGIFGGTAGSALTPLLVPERELDRANSRLVSVDDAASNFVGPPLGSTLFQVLRALPFGVDIALSVASAIFIRRLPGLPVRRGTRIGDIGRDVAAGARWLARHRRLRTLTLVTSVLAVTDSAWFSLMVLYVRDVLQLPADAYGWVIGAGAVGGLAGSVAATRLSRRFGRARCLLAALGLAAVTQACLGIFPAVVVCVLCLAASSFVFGIWNVVSVTLVQAVTPSDLLGRVCSAERTAVMGASPLGAFLGGLAGSAWGVRAPFLLGVPLLLVALVLARDALTDAART